jgi:uncharacterized protein
MIVINIIIGILNSSLDLLIAMAPYLLFGFLFAGILKEFISAEKIAKHLGKSSVGSVVKAALFGIPLPLCSCGVIPPTMALRKAGASRGAVLSFLIATPTSGVDSIAATYSLLGPFFAVYRVVASFFAGIFSGIVANVLDKEENKGPDSGDLENEKHVTKTLFSRLESIFHYAFIELLTEIGKWLVIGIFVGGLITYLIPESFFTNSLFYGWKAILLMLVVSVPLYVCATGSIPIAAALLMKGINPGAAFVFLLAGPATNAVTMTVITKYLGKKTALIYITTLVMSSLAFGLFLDLVWDSWGLSPITHFHGHSMVPYWLELASATVLAGLLFYLFIKNSFLFNKKEFVQKDKNNVVSNFNVPDMTCNNCVQHVEKALLGVDGVENVTIDLGTKKVNIEHADKATKQKLIDAINNSGYSVDQ